MDAHISEDLRPRPPSSCRSYPPLQPVDDDVIGIVRDVECHQTQVGEIPQELQNKDSGVSNTLVNEDSDSDADSLAARSQQDTPAP